MHISIIYYYVVMVTTGFLSLYMYMYVTMQDVEHTNGLLVSKYATLSEVVVRYKTPSLQQNYCLIASGSNPYHLTAVPKTWNQTGTQVQVPNGNSTVLRAYHERTTSEP